MTQLLSGSTTTKRVILPPMVLAHHQVYMFTMVSALIKGHKMARHQGLSGHVAGFGSLLGWLLKNSVEADDSERKLID